MFLLRFITRLCYSPVILKPILLNSDLTLTVMKKQTEIIAYAVSMILKAALFAVAWAGQIRRREMKSIAKMPIEEKDKELLFLRDPIIGPH